MSTQPSQEQLQQVLAEVQQDIDIAEKELQELLTEIEAIGAETVQANERIGELEETVSQLQDSNQASVECANLLDKQNHELQEQIASAGQDEAEDLSKIVAANKEEIQDHQRDIEEATQELQDHQEEIDALKDDIWEKEKSTTDLQAEVAHCTNDIAKFKADKATLTRKMEIILSPWMITRKDKPVAFKLTSAVKSANEVRFSGYVIDDNGDIAHLEHRPSRRFCVPPTREMYEGLLQPMPKRKQPDGDDTAVLVGANRNPVLVGMSHSQYQETVTFYYLGKPARPKYRGPNDKFAGILHNFVTIPPESSSAFLESEGLSLSVRAYRDKHDGVLKLWRLGKSKKIEFFGVVDMTALQAADKTSEEKALYDEFISKHTCTDQCVAGTRDMVMQQLLKKHRITDESKWVERKRQKR